VCVNTCILTHTHTHTHSRQPQRLITNHSPASRAGGDPAPTTLGANQVFTPSLHEVQGGHSDISDKVYNQVCAGVIYVYVFVCMRGVYTCTVE
jgi:hypothetical protein